jgi:hypothetical protein
MLSGCLVRLNLLCVTVIQYMIHIHINLDVCIYGYRYVHTGFVIFVDIILKKNFIHIFSLSYAPVFILPCTALLRINMFLKMLEN